MRAKPMAETAGRRKTQQVCDFRRPIATVQHAREIGRIGVFYDTVEETLLANRFAPHHPGRQQGFRRKAA